MKLRSVLNVVYDFFQVACAVAMVYYAAKGEYDMSTHYGVDLALFLLLQIKYK